MHDELTGRAAIETLAKRFPQLYVAPAQGAQETHRLAVGQGIAPEGANLDHFAGDDEDTLFAVETPAGSVEVLFLKKRADFETCLRIIGHKSEPVEIARTVGAITYRGLPDWEAVARAREEYLAGGGDDWNSEFRRLASIPGTFRAELVIVSEGPYSNVSADMTPYNEEEWIRISRSIRLNHECAHVVCRRLLPGDILAVWDEVTADVAGLLCATKHYDAQLAALFLGVTENGFAGGRLSEYLEAEQLEQINSIAAEVHAGLVRVETMADADASARPFEFLLDLKRSSLIQY